jgi:hypothetical protein
MSTTNVHSLFLFGKKQPLCLTREKVVVLRTQGKCVTYVKA